MIDKVFNIQPSISGKIRTRDSDANYKAVFECFYKVLPKEKFDCKNLKLVEQIKVIRSDKCQTCSQAIPKESAQYFDPFNKVNVCVNCAEKVVEGKEGIEKYHYPNNAIYVPAEAEETQFSIDDFKIGKNLQPEKGDKGE